MQSKADRARALFEEGYSCSQSVFGAFAEECGLEQKLAFQIASGLGGGVGRLRETCGAITGIALVLGIKQGYWEPSAIEEKTKLYAAIGELAERFRKRTGSIVCRELLGLSSVEYNPKPDERTAEYYQNRPCKELIALAAELLEEHLKV